MGGGKLMQLGLPLAHLLVRVVADLDVRRVKFRAIVFNDTTRCFLKWSKATVVRDLEEVGGAAAYCRVCLQSCKAQLASRT